MATYNVYNNVLIKMENMFLSVEKEVDQEILAAMTEQKKLSQKLTEVKGKVEALNALKRHYELYEGKEEGACQFKEVLLKAISDKQILLRLLQEKELLMNGCLLETSDKKLPFVIDLNREFKLRKRLQEVELLSYFLSEQSHFQAHTTEIDRSNELFDLAIQSGAGDKLEAAVDYFQTFLDKILNIYDLDPKLLADLKAFKAQIQLQNNRVAPFIGEDVASEENLQNAYRQVLQERMQLETEVEKLIYQYIILQCGKSILVVEMKNVTTELEAVVFKDYAQKQKIQELRQYKMDLNNQKDSLMLDLTVDNYSDALEQLETVTTRFRRTLMHHSYENKHNFLNRFVFSNQTKLIASRFHGETTNYHKMLFQLLHNSHVCAEDKAIILRLSKPSKLINTDSGKFFCQRANRTRPLEQVAANLRLYAAQEMH